MCSAFMVASRATQLDLAAAPWDPLVGAKAPVIDLAA